MTVNQTQSTDSSEKDNTGKFRIQLFVNGWQFGKYSMSAILFLDTYYSEPEPRVYAM